MRAQLSDPLPRDFVDAYTPVSCEVRGSARAVGFQPDGFSLWRIVARLDAGTELHWQTEHGDEALFVQSGGLEIDGKAAPAGSAVIIEAGVSARIRATTDALIVHFGPASPVPPTSGLLGPAAVDGHSVHVLPAESAAVLSSGGSATAGRYFTDGTCPTCRIAVFVIEFDGATGTHTAASHTHSEDEIIHVLDGEIQVGALRVQAGMSIAVPGGVRYGFRAGGAFRFLNYRRDVASYVGTPGSEPVVEVVSRLQAAFQALD